VRVGASPETEARRAAITLVTLAVERSRRERRGILTDVSDLTEIRDASRTFIADREWQQFQDPKSILLALVGEVGELAELLQWLPSDEARDRLHQEPLHTRVSEEMADVLVYLIGLADQCGVDLGSAALAKIKASADKYPTDQNRGIAPDKT
jgi:dCTP diphosphatase